MEIFLLPLYLIAFTSIIVMISIKQSSNMKLPPGPSRVPIIGNLHQLGELIHQSMWKLSQQHGPLMYLKLGNVPTVVVSSSDLAKQVLKVHDVECCSRAKRLVAVEKLSYGFSDVAFVGYGEKWKEHRRICVTELFNNKNLHSPYYVLVREEEVKLTMRSIYSCAESSLPINLSEALISLTSNIICRIAFGKSFTKDFDEFHDILREAQAMLAGLFIADYIPFIGWIGDVLTGMHGRLHKSFAKLDNFYDKLIEDHLHDEMDNKNDDVGRDILHVLLHLQRFTNKNLTDDCIKGILMNILIAGTDTSAAIIEWTMTELMRNPEVMKKAQDEVRNCIGRKRMIEENDLENFHYLKKVIKEAMRKHPPAPILVPRETMQHFKLNGYDIPPRTRLFVNTWAIGRDPNLWDKPEEFNPERFIDHKDYDFEVMPFGEGRRICPAKNLGLITVELALANFLYYFNWGLPSKFSMEDISLDELPGITVCKRDALWLIPSVNDII